MIVELIVLASVLLLFWRYKTPLPPDYPPTPPLRLPILGHMHYMLPYLSDANEGFYALYKKYGRDGMLALHLGPYIRDVVMGGLPSLTHNDGTWWFNRISLYDVWEISQ